MKTIGLIGGITPQSTILYYEFLNSLSANYLGAPHSCKVIINSLDFGVISAHQKTESWHLLDAIMVDAALSLEKAGANCILICANTMHLCIDAIKNVVSIPVIHIAEATAKQIIAKNISTVLLLGTKYTMEKTFFKDVLSKFGIKAIIPNQRDRQLIHDVIYDELANGKVKESSKQQYLSIIEQSIAKGVEGIILGCTEIPMLIQQKDVVIPVFDTTKIHAKAGFELLNQG
ncbi:MAG: amino acid racemase [Polaribacter sp.]|nr:amino acid racemase [Polaribacter sp.]